MTMSSPATTSGLSVDAAPARDRAARAAVREQSERLADAEDPLLGRKRARQRVVLRAADRAEQHGVAARARRSVASGSGWPAAS
jgi:hypothetical protein